MTTRLLLFSLPLLAASLSPASASTLAVAAGNTACAVISDNSTVFCASAGATHSSLSPAARVAQFVRFAQVSSGGGAVVCGIQLGGRALFCWPAAAPAQLRRVYNGPNPLSDLAVSGGGSSGHVAAYDSAARVIRWWRGGGRFPYQVAGGFASLVSGDEFTCAVETNTSAVRCWGPRGSAVEADFVNASVSSLAAGGSRVCAVRTGGGGGVLCSGSGAGEGALAPRDLYVDGLAVGESHACGLRRPNHTAACWSLGGPTTTLYSPAVGTEFEFLVAGGNLTCGLVSSNFSLMCWSTDGSVAAEVNLPAILPGVCVVPDNNNNSSCKCGVFPDFGRFCRVSGEVICKRFCDTSSPPSPPPPPASPTSRRGVSKWWIAFAVVGAVGCFAGICSIIYCLVFGFCSHKKIHNSVQPNLTAGNNNTTTAAATIAAAIGSGGPSPYGSPNGSLGRLRRQLSRVMTRQRSGPSSFKDPAEEFTFAQLAAATRDFSPEFKIGEGSFGTVYRGKLVDGREVAIKRGGGRKFQEKETAFRSELALLSRLHHKHLVGFVGYCEENDERLLVYEFMKNGALYDHLHPKPSSPFSSSPVATSWKLRIKILLDASRGIDYLHSYAVPSIIHRDIKSSNILIDASWTARVSDFGLSLMGPETATATATAPEAMKAAGTVGYMDPEYYGLHHLTVKSDVYGFGVVMLEVLTGKRAIFKEAEGGSPVSVVDYAVPSIVAGELAKVLDGRAPEPAPHEAEAVELVAYTAVHCVRLEGKDRPAMVDIVANLETAVALCDDGAGGAGGATGYGNSSSSASLSITSMELSRLD